MRALGTHRNRAASATIRGAVALGGWLAVLTLVTAGSVTLAQAAPEADSTLRVVDTASQDDEITIDVIVPRADSTQEVPADSFSVSDVQPPPEVAWLNEQWGVDLVLGSPPNPESPDSDPVAELRGAATGFLDRLSPEVPVRVITSDGVTDAGLDRSAAELAVREQPIEADGSIVEPLGDLPASDAPARAVVVFSTEDTEAVATAARGDQGDGTGTDTPGVLWHLQPGAEAGAPLTLTRTALHGGPAVEIDNPSHLSVGLDRVLVEMMGSYRLTIGDRPAGTPLEVRLATGNGTSTATVPAPTPAPSDGPDQATETPASTPSEPAGAADTEDGGGGGQILAVLAALVLVAVALAVTVGPWLRHRLRRPKASTAAAAGPGPVPEGDAPDAPLVSAHDLDFGEPSGATAGSEPSVVSPLPFGAAAVIDLTDPAEGAIPPTREEAATRVDDALALLVTRRSMSLQPIPLGLLIAVEAVFNARFDEATPDDDISRLLTPSGEAPSATSTRRARALTVALCRADSPGPHLARRLHEIIDVSADRLDEVDARFRAPVRTAPARPLTTRSILEEVTAVVEGDAPGAWPGGDGVPAAVGRCLLATWPARNGHLDRIPLILSPSLASLGSAVEEPGDTGDDGTGPDAIVSVLGAVSAALGRMTHAEIGFDALHFAYRERLRNLAPEETADRLASLLTRRPVLDIRVASSRLHMAPAATRRLLAELTDLGWLRYHDGTVATSTDAPDATDAGSQASAETWVAHEVIDTVIRPFAGLDAQEPMSVAELVGTRPPG